ncbi:MAG: PorV/PorQ family protein [bacterium]
MTKSYENSSARSAVYDLVRLKHHLALFAFVSLFLLAGFASAQTGLSFLKVGVGGRATGMGEAYTAVANDATAAYWNPAGLLQLGEKQIYLVHNEWFKDFRSEFVALALPAENYVLGLSLNSTNIGDIEIRGTQPSVEPIGTFTSHDLALGISYARSLTQRLDLGVGLKYIYQKIFIHESGGVAADLGFRYHTETIPLEFALTLQNFGSMSKLREESPRLPRLIRIGFAYSPALSLSEGSWIFAGDWVSDSEGNSHLHLGSEFQLRSFLAIRLGYQTGYELKNIHFGFGVQSGRLLWDYGFVPLQQDFGQGHRFSLGVNF